jgi:hypothetical protein
MEFRNMGFTGRAFIVARSAGVPWAYSANNNTTCEISDSNVLRITDNDQDEVTYFSPHAWISVHGPTPGNHDILDSVR